MDLLYTTVLKQLAAKDAKKELIFSPGVLKKLSEPAQFKGLENFIKATEKRKEKSNGYLVAGEVLKRYPLQEGLAFYIDSLKTEEDNFVLSSILRELALIETDESVDISPIINLTYSDSLQLRIGAIGALSYCKDKRARQRLLEILKDSDPKENSHDILSAFPAFYTISTPDDIKLTERITQTKIAPIKDGSTMVINTIKKRESARQAEGRENYPIPTAKVKKIILGKSKLIPLLLEGDPSVGKYIKSATLYAIYDDKQPITAAVVIKTADECTEIKNIVTASAYRNQGYGGLLVNYIEQLPAPQAQTLLVSAADTNKTAVDFFQNLHFTYRSTVKNYFADNYDEPMFFGGESAKDLIYFNKDLY